LSKLAGFGDMICGLDFEAFTGRISCV